MDVEAIAGAVIYAKEQPGNVNLNEVPDQLWRRLQLHRQLPEVVT